MKGGKCVSPQVPQKGLEAGPRLSRFLGHPLPHQGSELGHGDPRPPASEGPPGKTPPWPGLRKWRVRAATAPKRWRCARREPPPRPRPGPPRSPLPPRSWRAHRLHGGGHVVVTLRLLRQPRPLQQLLSVPHVARDSASPRAPALPARRLARSLSSRLPVRFPVAAEAAAAAAAHAHWLAGWREACKLRRRSRPLAGWLHALWRAPRSRRERRARERRGRASGGE